MTRTSQKVEFESDGLILSGRLTLGPGRGFRPGVVICHPHPAFGGSMDNNVVEALESALSGRGFATLAFNFRGVGRSQGAYDNMKGEARDVIAALAFLARQSEVDHQRLGLAGYSFGALMAMFAASESAEDGVEPSRKIPLQALALVAPMPPGPVWNRERRLKTLLASPPPTLIVTGTMDRFCPVNSAKDLAAEIGMDSRLMILEGVDHFYWGREDEAALASADFMAGLLGK